MGSARRPHAALDFELVVARPRAVGELAEVLPISRPAVSQHLKLLKTAGSSSTTPRGPGGSTGEPRRIAGAAQTDRFWTQALANFKQLVDQPEEEP